MALEDHRAVGSLVAGQTEAGDPEDRLRSPELLMQSGEVGLRRGDSAELFHTYDQLAAGEMIGTGVEAVLPCPSRRRRRGRTERGADVTNYLTGADNAGGR